MARKVVVVKPRWKKSTVFADYAKKKRRLNPRVSTAIGRRTNHTEQGFVNGFIPGLIKPKWYGKFRYGAATLVMAASTSQTGTYVFTANGLFDPNLTGGALKPAGFSQLMALYDHYTVLKSKISVTFTNNTTQPVMVSLGLTASPDPTGTDTSDMLEQPYQQMVQLEPAAAYGSSKTLSMSCNLSKYFGTPVSKSQALYRGDVGKNPDEQAYYMCRCFGLKGGSAEVYLTAVIEYDAMCTEPRALPAE